MRKYKLFFIGLILIGIPACDWLNPCNCSPVQGLYIDILGIESGYITSNGSPRSQRDTLDLNHGIRMNLAYSINYISETECSKPSFNWGSSAYACSCAMNGESGVKSERYSAIRLISAFEYDSTHPAGSDVADYLLFNTVRLTQLNVQDYIKDSDFARSYGEDFILDQLPSSDVDSLKLTIEIDFTNGESYSFNYPKVFLKR